MNFSKIKIGSRGLSWLGQVFSSIYVILSSLGFPFWAAIIGIPNNIIWAIYGKKTEHRAFVVFGVLYTLICIGGVIWLWPF